MPYLGCLFVNGAPLQGIGCAFAGTERCVPLFIWCTNCWLGSLRGACVAALLAAVAGLCAGMVTNEVTWPRSVAKVHAAMCAGTDIKHCATQTPEGHA